MSDKTPARGFFGWLGRQIGYVKKAVESEVGEKKIYRNEQVEQQPHPQDPNVTLRRTTIDEVIVKKQSN